MDETFYVTIKITAMKKDIFREHTFKAQNNIIVNGLESFRKSIEKDFFCEASIKTSTSETKVLNLAVELHFNFELIETIFLHKRNRLDIKKSLNSTRAQLYPFFKALYALKQQNEEVIDLAELSIFLNDTSFIIHKIYPQSINQQIASIWDEICRHYVIFSKELSEIPYEIYIPIYNEDHLFDNKVDYALESGYFKYWGLYFNSEENPSIYNLENKTILDGDVFLLNQ